MKRISRVLIAVAFVFMFAAVIIPSSQIKAAAKFAKTINVYADNSLDGEFIDLVEGASKSVKFKKVKSSDRSVLDISYAMKNMWDDGKTCNLACRVRARKVGTAKITYYYNNTKKTVEVKVLPYENPMKSIKLFGIKEDGSANLAKATKYAGCAWLDDDITSNKISFSTNAGWIVADVAAWSDTEGVELNYNKFIDKSSGSATIKLPDNIQRFVLSINCYNTKTKATKQLFYQITKN